LQRLQLERIVMKLDHPPLFRKIIVPWYDSEIFCLVAIIFLFAVMLLGIVGINVAKSTQQYQEYLWMPSLLTVLSGGVVLSIVIRLVRRFF
jgi:quinol-cytochrome oxidoreductase complex cytochrome b subunit